jgi:hypothetical protein
MTEHVPRHFCHEDVAAVRRERHGSLARLALARGKVEVRLELAAFGPALLADEE